MSTAQRPPIRIVLIDDSELVRRGVKSVLSSVASEPPMHVVGEANTVAEGVRLCQELKPLIVLLDIRLPDGNGFDACRQILRHLPDTRVIILTAHTNDNLVYDAVTAGAHGYLQKEVDAAGLIQALQDVSVGRQSWPFSTVQVSGFDPSKSSADAVAAMASARTIETV